MSLFSRRRSPRRAAPGEIDELIDALTVEATRPHPDRSAISEILDAVVALDAPGLESLLEALQGPEDAVRAVVADRLRTLKDPRTLGTLIVALRDRQDGVRAAAATALTHMGDPRAAASLARALDDTCPDVRRRAALALGERADPRAVPELVQLAAREPSALAWEMVRWFAQAEHPLPGVPPPLDRPPSVPAVAAVLRPILTAVPGLAGFVRAAADRSVFDLDGDHVLETVRSAGLRSAGA
jgi:hypothetical protein